ncbi:MAG: hypothetical protein WBL21_01990, partial [Salinimicrobium sp.]
MKDFTINSLIHHGKLESNSKKSISAIFVVILFLFLAPSIFAQATGPCDGAIRWEGGASWNDDGTINDKPPQNEPVKGIIKCGSSAETQSDVIPYNGSVYTESSFLIDVESEGGCVNPSTGEVAYPENPEEGQPVIWLNFDVRPLAGSFEVQINENSAANYIAWALYVSNVNTAGVGDNNLSGDCGDLRLVSCGVESSSTWNTLPIDGVDFLEPTNFYLAVWDQLDDNNAAINNFKARFGCGDSTIELCSLNVGDPEVSCVVDGSYTVTVPINGVNGQFTATDLNATQISQDICLGNIGDGGDTSGEFVLTYSEGIDYNINIAVVSPPDIDCADPYNDFQCTGNVSGESPESVLVTADDTSVCIGSKVQLSASPAEGTWSGDYISASGEFDADGLAADDYIVTYTYSDGNGCENSDTAT